MRSPNFTAKEKQELVDFLLEEERHIKVSLKFGPIGSIIDKNNIWELATERINLHSPVINGVKIRRERESLQHLWMDLRHKVKKEAIKFKKSLKSNGPGEPLKPSMDAFIEYMTCKDEMLGKIATTYDLTSLYGNADVLDSKIVRSGAPPGPSSASAPCQDSLSGHTLSAHMDENTLWTLVSVDRIEHSPEVVEFAGDGFPIAMEQEIYDADNEDASVKSIKQWKILRDVPDRLISQVKLAAVGRLYMALHFYTNSFQPPGADISVSLLVTFSDEVYAVSDNNAFFGFAAKKENPALFKKIGALSNRGIEEFVFGWDFVVARTSSGNILTWGLNAFCQLGTKRRGEAVPVNEPCEIGLINGEAVKKVACGYSHVLCLTNQGKLFAWGQNCYGQLGCASPPEGTEPQSVDIETGTEIVDVSCTSFSSFALTKDGKIYGWGYNTYGELGDATMNSRITPAEIRFPRSIKIQKIACGIHHVLAVTTDGVLYAWGSNTLGQVGVNSQTNVLVPTRISSIQTIVKDVASGLRQETSLCQTESNVFSWGYIYQQCVLEPKETSFATIEDACANYGMPRSGNWRFQQKDASTVEPDLHSFINDQQNHKVAFTIDGKIVRGTAFFLERSEYLKKKFAREWNRRTIQNPIPITDAKFPVFAAFVNFLHTDQIDIPHEHMIELFNLAQRFGMKLLWLRMIDILLNSITVENAVETYKAGRACQIKRLWAGAATFIAPNFFSIMEKEPDVDVPGKVLKDIRALGIKLQQIP